MAAYQDSGDSHLESGHDSAGLNGQEDEDEEVTNSTLYELTGLQEYTGRKVEADDISTIRNLLKDEDYYQFRFEDPLLLFETCCFSLVISDVIEADRLLAAAFFDDKPVSADLFKNSKKWKPANDLRGMVPINTYHMKCFICSPEVAEDVCLTEIISYTFSSSIHIDYIIVEMPDLKYKGPYTFSPLAKEIEVVLTGKQRRKIIVYQKDTLMPQLVVREGREHDLDDLQPILPMEPAVMEQHFGKSNLSDIISMAERGNQSMTAEWKTEAVGIISVSADIDYEMLSKFYHLELFHGLRKPHRNDEIFINEKVIRIHSDIDFQNLYNHARQTFREGKIARDKDQTLPYEVEIVKEFSMASMEESDDENSAFAQKAKGPHQFTLRVSEDIIIYDLKPRGSLGPEDFGCGYDRTSESKSDLPIDVSPQKSQDTLAFPSLRLSADKLEVVLDPTNISPESSVAGGLISEHVSAEKIEPLLGKPSMSVHTSGSNAENAAPSEHVSIDDKPELALEKPDGSHETIGSSKGTGETTERLSIEKSEMASYGPSDRTPSSEDMGSYAEDFPAKSSEPIQDQDELELPQYSAVVAAAEAVEVAISEMEEMNVESMVMEKAEEILIESPDETIMEIAEEVILDDRDPDPEEKTSVFRGIGNALAVKLFNMGKKYIPRNMCMFKDIFKSFPNREYLIVTIPVGGNVKEPAWLDNFVRVIPRAETSYPRDLFVLHKVVITSKVRVRRARQRDMGDVRNFLSSLMEKDKIFQDFLHSFDKSGTSIIPKMTAYVAQVKNYEGMPIIGLAIVSPELEAGKYVVNYDLEKHTYFGAHAPASAHGYVHHLLINPIFQRHARLFLKEVMRQDEKECLFHKVYPEFISNQVTQHQSILNNMEDWIPLLPRKRIHYEDLNLTKAYDDERQPPPQFQENNGPYAVIHTAKKFIMEPKISLTKRIVFVGASTAAISCLEKLISSTYRSFKYLTIIDPHGLPGSLPEDPVRNEFFAVRNGGTKMSYATDAEWILRAGIHLWVKVVIGKVTRIVRDGKYVVVNSDSVVLYDKLILAPGQQFQRLDCPKAEINDPNFMAFKKNTATSELQRKAVVRLEFVRDTPKPKNAFMINTEFEAHTALQYLRRFRQLMQTKKVLVFGGGLQLYACVKALLAFGIPASSIVLIHAPENEIEWEKDSGYTLSSKVRVPMEREMANLGVNRINNYEFNHWETCPVSGLITRTHFKSLTEHHAQISFGTFALFCYRYKRVDDDIVSALSEAYLLYQNGIIIDVGFRTNDPDIYAIGTATTYQKILLAGHQNHIYYQSEEIGHKLAEVLVDACSTGIEAVAQQGPPEALNVIKFRRPYTRAIILPGGWHYLYLRSPGSTKRCNVFAGSTCQETCECLTEVVTGSVNIEDDPSQHFFKVRLDDRSRIVSLECMSKTPFSFSNMTALYGKHEVLLNKLMERLEIGETTCLYKHFKQSWFAVFCVDEWDNFADELKELYREHDIGDGTKLIQFIRDFIVNLDNPEALQMDPNIIRSVWRSSKLKDIVEQKLLAFLKFHRSSLPMFAENNYVEDLLEERSTSALYYPTMQHPII